MPRGRPTSYTLEIADAICQRLSEGEPLRAICRDEAMPPWRTVYAWREADPEFAARIAHARESGYDVIAEETLEIADDGRNDYVGKGRGRRLDAEHVQRSKLRVDTRLKLLSKWNPKRYGDRLELDAQVKGSLVIATGVPGVADDLV